MSTYIFLESEKKSDNSSKNIQIASIKIYQFCLFFTFAMVFNFNSITFSSDSGAW